MSELQAAKNRKREYILRGVAEHLSSEGVKASVGTEPIVDYYGNDAREMVVEMSGSTINKIKLLAYDYGTANTTFRYRYQLEQDGAMPAGFNKAIYARLKLVKQNKVLGLFSGEVTGVRWEGQKTAELLNADSELSAKLMEFVRNTGNADIQVYVKSPDEIEILGPKFTAPFSLLAENELMDKFIDKSVSASQIGIFENIGKHVRQVIKAA